MKTYIVFTNKGMVATLANNKKEAYISVSSKMTDRKVSKSGVYISSCHLDFVTCEKIKIN